MLLTSFLAWVVNRLTTHLLNPPDLKIWSMLSLTAPPPAAGVVLALIPIWIYLQFGNLFIYGVFYYSPSATVAPLGTAIMEIANNQTAFNSQYMNLGNTVSTTEMISSRAGRTGSVFCIVGFACLFAGNRFYFPKKETKRELEYARTITKIAKKKKLWRPVFWRQQNFMYSSFLSAMVCLLIVEFSYSKVFVKYEFQARIILYIFGKIFDRIIQHQLQDYILAMPVSNAIAFFSYIIIFHSLTFIEFLLASFFLFGLSMLNRIYVDSIILFFVSTFKSISAASLDFLIQKSPKYLRGVIISLLHVEAKFDPALKEKRKIEGM